jgi:hypothetical protein
MEFLAYKRLPQSIADDLMKKVAAQKKNVA